MSEKPFDFYQDHSVHFLEMALRQDRNEAVARPDGYGKKRGECGDTVEMFITMEGGRLRQVNFNVYGCLNTNACCNTVAHLAEGRTLEEAWEITPEDVVRYLETLPEDHHHCAELAVGAFYLTLADVRLKQKSPWMKLYGRPELR